jgi:hypothetical protein
MRNHPESVSITAFGEKRWGAGVGAIAVTAYVVPRAFITAETSFRRYFTRAALDREGLHLKVGFGVSFGRQ